jgi:hypothetical protein
MEEFEWNGIWWLPDRPQDEVSGNLRFNPAEKTTLELIGSFERRESLSSFSQPDIILGVTSDGKVVTLYKCYESQSRISVPGFVRSSFIVSVIFLGHHFEKKEEVRFSSLSLNYSHLAEWAGITGIKYRRETDRRGCDVEYEVKYSFPERVEAQVGSLTISFDCELTSSGDRLQEVHLRQTTFMKITPEQPLHFDDYMRDACHYLQTFLSLGIGRAVRPLIVKGKSEACKARLEDGRETYGDVFVYYAINDPPREPRQLNPFDMLFSFGDISGSFQQCLSNWFDKWQSLQPVYDLYFGTLYHPSMYLQHEFLSLAQAIESYQRRTQNGEYLSHQDYEYVYEALVAAIPQELESDFRVSLKERLKYHNEFSLRRRLRAVLERCGDITTSLIDDDERFVDDVVNTRNFLTHYDESLKAKAKSGGALYWLTRKIGFLLEISFLMEIEIPVKTIKVLVSRNERYQYLTARQ